MMGLNHRDGPSENLINFMDKYEGLAPLGWQGIR